MTHVPIDDLTFGVELEVILPRDNNGQAGREALAAAMTAAGVAASAESYNHQTRAHWKVITDGSIGHENAEVVSPILRGAEGFAALRRAVDTVDAFGCRVNRQTGFHVHVGARDRFAGQIGFFKELLRTYAKFEPVLDSIMAPSRRARSNQWCQPVRWNEDLERATTVRQLQSALASRYVKLNLQAFATHGTVEFRQHQGTTNAQKVENWVRLCLRMVAHAAKNTEPSREPVTVPRRPEPPYLYHIPNVPSTPDLTRATRVTGDAIPRFTRENERTLRDLAISYVIPSTPRREGTAGRENHDQHNVWAGALASGGETADLWSYHRHGGRRTHLAWDVDHGYVHVVRISSAPRVPVPEGSMARREHEARVEWRQRVNAERTAQYEEALARYNEATSSAVEPTFERPPTDAAPATLEGLLELVGADAAERTYFTERQMELNA